MDKLIDKLMLSKFVKKTFLALVILSPPLYLLYLIRAYGVVIPFGDQWALVPLLDKLFGNNLRFSDLWAQHNEHRIVFPKMLMLTMAYFSDWNIWYELYMNFVLAGIIFLLLLFLLKKTFVNQTPIWLTVAFSFIIFSPIQWENWLWGWEIQVFMTIFGTVAAVLSLVLWPGQLKGLIIAMAAAVFASFSFANGILTWLAGGLIMLMQKKSRWMHIALWVVVSASTICLYYYQYVKPSYHPALSVCLHSPWAFVQYVLAYIGSPLAFGSTSVAIITGAVWVIAMCAVLIHIGRFSGKSFAPVLPWMALAVYAFLSDCVTGVARLGFGTRQAMESRYTTIASLFIVSVLAVSVYWARAYMEAHRNFPKGLVVLKKVFFLLVISAYGLSFGYGIAKMQMRAERLRAGRICLKNYERAPDLCLRLLYPEPDIVRERARTLSRLGIILPKSEAVNQTLEQSTSSRKD